MFDYLQLHQPDDDDVFLRLEDADTGATAVVVTAPRATLGEDGPVVHQLDESSFCVVFSDEIIADILSGGVDLLDAEVQIEPRPESDDDRDALDAVVGMMVRQGRIVRMTTDAIRQFRL